MLHEKRMLKYLKIKILFRNLGIKNNKLDLCSEVLRK